MKEEVKEASQTAMNVVQSVSDGNFWETYGNQIISIGNCILSAIVIILFGYIIKKLVGKLIDNIMKKYTNVDVSLITIMNKTASFIIWGIVILMLLDLCGVNTASILTVLGASALAIGIALKDTLSNIAAGIFLLCQRPYKTGDYVECGGVAGTIKEIGLFTTKLQTPQGQDIFVPNNAIMTGAVINYSSNELRRADIPISISYNDNVEKAVAEIRRVISNYELIVNNPAPNVLVNKYANNGIELNIRYWTKNSDYWAAYWKINESLQFITKNAGLTIPYPQLDVHFNNKDVVNSNII